MSSTKLTAMENLVLFLRGEANREEFHTVPETLYTEAAALDTWSYGFSNLMPMSIPSRPVQGDLASPEKGEMRLGGRTGTGLRI